MRKEDRSLTDFLSTSEQDTMLRTMAYESCFCRVPVWAFYLNTTRREQIVLGRIYSFQCTLDSKTKKRHEFRMSLSTLARELNLTNRAEAQKILNSLIAKGFVIKKPNGNNKPATYLVDEAKCMSTALGNGYLGNSR